MTVEKTRSTSKRKRQEGGGGGGGYLKSAWTIGGPNGSTKGHKNDDESTGERRAFRTRCAFRSWKGKGDQMVNEKKKKQSPQDTSQVGVRGRVDVNSGFVNSSKRNVREGLEMACQEFSSRLGASALKE